MPEVTNNQARIFCRLTKVDEEKRLVYGRATEECIDRAGEVFDYTTSKPFFEQWSAECHRDSGGKSYGNLRAMHGSIAAGRLESIEFLDDDKAIDVAAKVIDDNEWKKVMEGVYTGFSVGGQYQKKWKDKFEGKPVQRFTAMPAELSLVDRPCVPTAKFFDIHKADGTTVQKEFVAPTSATSGIAPYNSKRKRKKAVKKALEALDCMKGMGAVAGLAGLIAQLRSIYENAKAENVAEDNGESAVPTKLRSAVQVLSAVLAEMAVEESAELSDGKNELDFSYIPYRASAQAGDLQKSVAGFLGLAKASGFDPEQLATLQSLHDTACSMGAACSHTKEDTQMADANDKPLTKADVETVVGEVLAKTLQSLGLTKDELSGEGAKRGTGVKMGVSGNQSANAEDSPKDGKMSPTERASNKSDWSDEDMDKACEMDSDEEWEEKKAKKSASKKSWDRWEEKRAAKKRAAKADAGYLTKADIGEIVGGVLQGLFGDAAPAGAHQGRAPALFAVEKTHDNTLGKADGGGQDELPKIMQGGKVNEGATELLKVWSSGPSGFVTGRGNAMN